MYGLLVTSGVVRRGFAIALNNKGPLLADARDHVNNATVQIPTKAATDGGPPRTLLIVGCTKDFCVYGECVFPENLAHVIVKACGKLLTCVLALHKSLMPSARQQGAYHTHAQDHLSGHCVHITCETKSAAASGLQEHANWTSEAAWKIEGSLIW